MIKENSILHQKLKQVFTVELSLLISTLVISIPMEAYDAFIEHNFHNGSIVFVFSIYVLVVITVITFFWILHLVNKYDK